MQPAVSLNQSITLAAMCQTSKQVVRCKSTAPLMRAIISHAAQLPSCPAPMSCTKDGQTRVEVSRRVFYTVSVHSWKSYKKLPNLPCSTKIPDSVQVMPGSTTLGRVWAVRLVPEHPKIYTLLAPKSQQEAKVIWPSLHWMHCTHCTPQTIKLSPFLRYGREHPITIAIPKICRKLLKLTVGDVTQTGIHIWPTVA